MLRYLLSSLLILLSTCTSTMLGINQTGGLHAQDLAFNTALRDNFTYGAELNDVWGYVAPDGTEYAIVGKTNGISIVSLADPDNLVEVGTVAGGSSVWRDMKTFGEYAYVVADQRQEGITVIDLSNLPNGVTFERFDTDNTSPGGPTLTRAHNIYIDEPTGLAYLAGANVNAGGMVIYDVATTPGTPSFVAFAPAVYAHDVYVQDGIMYASEISGGELTMYDVSDPLDISEIGSTPTPRTFTHNAWTTTSGDYIFTTDERGNAPVAAYDITDPLDIKLLDEFRPVRSLNTGVIPHNVHVTADDYLVISYYTDGVVVVDASVPDNLVEVAYYDHWSGADGGFFGSWGAYPFLPSGLVLSTDIENGLYVVDVDYQRAARLRGTVTDAENGASLNNVEVTISSSNPAATSSLATGRYKTGVADEGTFTVTYSLAGYNPVSLSLDFVRGEELLQDVSLTRKMLVSITGDVTNAETGGAVAGAGVRIVSEDGPHTTVSDANGTLSFNEIFTGDYEGFAGRWGFRDQMTTATLNANGDNISFVLEPGFRDGFAVDQGWTVSGDPGSGDWVRGRPVGTGFNGQASNPGADADADVGDFAFVTGNGGGSAGFDDVDGGTTVLSSPVFDPADVGFGDVMVRYAYWFFNAGGNGSPDDEMTVSLFNGTQREILRTYTASDNTTAWTGDAFNLSDASIPLTTTMQVEVTIGDTGSGHVVEGGFDDFELTALGTLPVELTAFTAVATAKQTTRLAWTTATEVNASHFVVERSTDGRAFSAIGRETAAGDATLPSSYEFEDNSARSGDNFYRLRLTDQDGSFAFSEVRTVWFAEGETELAVYPNPTGDYLYFRAPVEGPVRVYGMDGRLVLEVAVAVANNRIDVTSLSSGPYIIRAANNTAKMMVKR